MFFHISIHALKAIEVSDHPFDPLDGAIELYQTWHLAALEEIAATSPSSWARQGSSSRGAPDDGVTVRDGDSLLVSDPQITLGLSERAAEADHKMQYRLDFHHWDSDSATEKVRAAFTDITLNYMLAAFKAAHEDAAAARAALERWVGEQWKTATKAITASSAPTGPWTKIGLNLIPMLELLVDVLRKDGDDYLDMHRFILQHRGTGGKVEWQVTGPTGQSSGWKGTNQSVDAIQRVMDAPRGNKIDVTYRFRLVGD
jgi:hypothetical protein